MSRHESSKGRVEYKMIPSLPGYCASSRGRVFSSLRGGTWTAIKSSARGRDAQEKVHKRKMVFIAFLPKDGETARARELWRLDAAVAEAFHGPAPDGMVVIHRDGDHRNCKPSNLYYGTAIESLRAEKARQRGTNSALSKLNAEKVVAIRQSVNRAIVMGEKIPWETIAAVAGVTPDNCKAVAKGKTWTEVDAGVPLWVPGPVNRFHKGSPKAYKLTLAEVRDIQARFAAHERAGAIHARYPQVGIYTIMGIKYGSHKRKGL